MGKNIDYLVTIVLFNVVMLIIILLYFQQFIIC